MFLAGDGQLRICAKNAASDVRKGVAQKYGQMQPRRARMSPRHAELAHWHGRLASSAREGKPGFATGPIAPVLLQIRRKALDPVARDMALERDLASPMTMGARTLDAVTPFRSTATRDIA